MRRFGPAELKQLDACIDEEQRRVWKQRYGKRKQELALVDLDSHVRQVYGCKKEGVDFSYKGTWAYHPLVITLAGTQEVLRLVNRPGNVASAEDAEVHLASVMPMLCERFRRVVTASRSPTSTTPRHRTSSTSLTVVCDQQNIVEQLQNGVAAMRMPTGELLPNAAFLTCARLAHNLKSRFAQLALPPETMRWEWKRFRLAFLHIAATVVHHARQIVVRLARSHRFHEIVVLAHQRLLA